MEILIFLILIAAVFTFYRLCFTLRTNIILISYSYYKFTISNSIHCDKLYYEFEVDLHFILALVILFIIILHLFALHLTGSLNPLGSNYNNYKVSFHPYFSIQDLL